MADLDPRDLNIDSDSDSDTVDQNESDNWGYSATEGTTTPDDEMDV